MDFRKNVILKVFGSIRLTHIEKKFDLSGINEMSRKDLFAQARVHFETTRVGKLVFSFHVHSSSSSVNLKKKISKKKKIQKYRNTKVYFETAQFRKLFLVALH